MEKKKKGRGGEGKATKCPFPSLSLSLTVSPYIPKNKKKEKSLFDLSRTDCTVSYANSFSECYQIEKM